MDGAATVTAVAVEGLRKRYGDHEAVRGVDFSVEDGRDLRAARTERRGQDHHAGDSGGVPGTGRRQCRGARTGPGQEGGRAVAARADWARAPGHRHRAVSDGARDHRAQRRLLPAPRATSTRSSTWSVSTRSAARRSRTCPVGRSGGSTWRSASSVTPGCSSWTSRRPGSTRMHGVAPGTSYGICVTPVRPSC